MLCLLGKTLGWIGRLGCCTWTNKKSAVLGQTRRAFFSQVDPAGWGWMLCGWYIYNLRRSIEPHITRPHFSQIGNAKVAINSYLENIHCQTFFNSVVYTTGSAGTLHNIRCVCSCILLPFSTSSTRTLSVPIIMFIYPSWSSRYKLCCGHASCGHKTTTTPVRKKTPNPRAFHHFMAGAVRRRTQSQYRPIGWPRAYVRKEK